MTQSCPRTTKEIAELRHALHKQANAMAQIKVKILQNPPTISIPHIQVTYTNGNIGASLPKFNCRARNPKEYLDSMMKYHERNIQRETNPSEDARGHLLELLEWSLESHATRWCHIMRCEVKNWDDCDLV